MPDQSRPGLTTTVLSIESHQDGRDKSATAKHSIRLSTEQFTIGTWDVRTLYDSGRTQELSLGDHWDV